jgi:hypothetical protein
MTRKTPKKASVRKPVHSKTPRKPARRRAPSTRKERRAQIRFLVGSLPAVRGTLARLSHSFFLGDIGEHTLRALTYSLSAIARMFIVESELQIEERLRALEESERNRGHAR